MWVLYPYSSTLSMKTKRTKPITTMASYILNCVWRSLPWRRDNNEPMISFQGEARDEGNCIERTSIWVQGLEPAILCGLGDKSLSIAIVANNMMKASIRKARKCSKFYSKFYLSLEIITIWNSWSQGGVHTNMFVVAWCFILRKKWTKK